MRNYQEITDRLAAIGLMGEAKYQFLPGPLGLTITKEDKNELESIGSTASVFVRRVRNWYDEEKTKSRGSRLAALLEKGVPSEYVKSSTSTALPFTMMVDTVWTSLGWRIVEIDVTNRNAMGYPLVMRHIYDLSSVWRGIDHAWREEGWSGVIQVMADHHRFYEPYFRFFLKQLGGELVTEADLPDWIRQNHLSIYKLLDLPILFRSKAVLPELLALSQAAKVAIPPVHALSSKAVLALPWESEQFGGDPIMKYVPETRFLWRVFTPPGKEFFVKLLQSGGAHGTFHNDHEKLERFLMERRPQAIWQEALPLAQRSIAYLTSDNQLITENRFVRISIFITEHGEVVDADATASPGTIVHGSKQSIMTVPVLM